MRVGAGELEAWTGGAWPAAGGRRQQADSSGQLAVKDENRFFWGFWQDIKGEASRWWKADINSAN